MAANGREIEISEFAFRQQSALPIVAVSAPSNYSASP